MSAPVIPVPAISWISSCSSLTEAGWRGITPKWQMKRDMLSLSYTTQWGDLPRAMIR
ncbi:DUF4113 domain-containing protein (plasmid) [Enterobacter sp. RHB15-C17]|nr:DUF4113 domain-containing protein [Enterobacter sp. RHB15-C17]